MASGLYKKYKQKCLEGGADRVVWLTDNIKAVLVDAADYAVNLTTHEFLSDIPAAARVATSDNLTGKTSTNGIADANDTVFVGAAGDTSEIVVLYKDTGVEATSPLMCYIDSGVGLPVSPNGADLDCIWNALGIYEL